ncbi:hypothetical protein [Nitrospira sp. Nam74]
MKGSAPKESKKPDTSSPPTLLSDDKLAYRVKDGWSRKDAQDRDAPLVGPVLSVIRNVLKEHAGENVSLCAPMGKQFTAKDVDAERDILVISKKRSGRLLLHTSVSALAIIIFRYCSKIHSQQLRANQSAAMELLGQQTTTVNRFKTHTEEPEVVEAAQNFGPSVGQGVLAFWLAQRNSDDVSRSEAIESKRVPR